MSLLGHRTYMIISDGNFGSVKIRSQLVCDIDNSWKRLLRPTLNFYNLTWPEHILEAGILFLAFLKLLHMKPTSTDIADYP